MVVDLTFLVGPGHAQGVVSRLCPARRSTAGLAGMPTGEGRTNRSRTQHLRRRPGQGASDCSLISAPVRTPRPNSHLARTVGPGFRGGHFTCPGCSVLVRASNEMLCRVMPKQEPWAQPNGQSGIFPARPGNLREGPQSLACAYREPPAAYARRRLTSQQSLN